jgi:hypothetical protein
MRRPRGAALSRDEARNSAQRGRFHFGEGLSPARANP